MKFQDDISNMITYIHTYIRTSRNQYVPHFFKVGGIKRGECRCRGLDLTQNHLKMEKKTKKEEKKRKKKLCSERDMNPRPSDYKSCT